MKYSENYGFNLPDQTDNYDVDVFNDNMDNIDTIIYGHITDKSNPHGVTKAQVGLGNVNNTSDAAKNVLSATKLTTARKINGVSFNGTADITVSANPKQNSLTDESLNDVIDFGFYFAAGGNTVTDFPTGASTNGTTVGGFSLIVAQAGGAGRLQTYTSDKGVWFRIASLSGTTANWEGWIKVYNSVNKPTKSDVGLGNVDNTADIDKPISSAVQAALDNLKRGCMVRDKSGSGEKFYKYASILINLKGADRTIAFQVSGRYSSYNNRMGVLKAIVRQGELGAVQSAKLVWAYANSEINPGDFKMICKSNADESIEVELYVRINKSWLSYSFEVIDEGGLTDQKNYWSLYNLPDGVDSLPTGDVIDSELSPLLNPVMSCIPYYTYGDKIAEGLEVYSISLITSNPTLSVNKNYGVGDSFYLIINSDNNASGDFYLDLYYNNSIIHTGIIDDAEGNSIYSLEGGVLYKATIKGDAEDKSGGYTFEKTETSTAATVETDRTININDVFFLHFNYTSGVISTGIQLQTNCNGTTSAALYLYGTDNKKVTAVETNRMYLIKRRSNGFYMMKIG